MSLALRIFLREIKEIRSSDLFHQRRISQNGSESIKRSIDMAQQFGSKVVVIHSGHVDPSKQLENRMRELIASGSSHTTEFCDLKEKLIRFRAEQAPPHFESVKKSIRELLDYAKPHNIRLGIEMRYHYLEIPSPDELEVLLSLAIPDQIGFIYDIGHAETLDRLGFYPHEEWLKRFAARIIGTHIHDVIGTTDHLAPGLGEVDFDMVARYLPAQAIRTCEFQDVQHPRTGQGWLDFLAAKGCISKNCSDLEEYSMFSLFKKRQNIFIKLIQNKPPYPGWIGALKKYFETNRSRMLQNWSPQRKRSRRSPPHPDRRVEPHLRHPL